MNLLRKVSFPEGIYYSPSMVTYCDHRGLFIYTNSMVSYVTSEGLLYGYRSKYQYITSGNNGIPYATTVGYYDPFHLGPFTFDSYDNSDSGSGSSSDGDIKMEGGYIISTNHVGDIVIGNSIDQFEYYIHGHIEYVIRNYDLPRMNVTVVTKRYDNSSIERYLFEIVRERINPLVIKITIANQTITKLKFNNIGFTRQSITDGIITFSTRLNNQFRIATDELRTYLDTITGLIELTNRVNHSLSK